MNHASLSVRSTVERFFSASRGACIGIGVAAVVAHASVAHADPVDLRFATVGIGGSWYAYGQGMGPAIQSQLPAGSRVDVLPISGGVGNMELVQNGEAEIAIAFSHTAGEACSEDGGLTFDGQRDKVRAVMGALDTFYLAGFATVRSGIESWEDVASDDKRVRMITTQRGGTGELGMRQILEAHGSSYDGVRSAGGSVRALERAATAAAFADGSADFWGHTVTVAHPVATELMTVTDMRVIGIHNEAAIEELVGLGWTPVTLPAGSFEGQDEDLPMVGTGSSIVVSADLSDEVVYAITKALVESVDRFPDFHAALSGFDLEVALDPGVNGNCPFHPGAVAYYRDAGLMD
ncbi:TRAP transporter TAXI family solute receptor [Natronocella acetinitrilica]|uniref:TRAP transporter TAXI family solute receptor n=1 Tax=Natronocella acetinitrilica TaxID=414046 RepID=A0AAE3G8I2_9GAMM|nr:TAXI family TRAP transporter solute-binding subunit [Natronocella acetinitrilica]MCP1676736.1 TRAP transporter TAXI family solute receptor [Natronocella acetinitrilica]